MTSPVPLLSIIIEAAIIGIVNSSNGRFSQNRASFSNPSTRISRGRGRGRERERGEKRRNRDDEIETYDSIEIKWTRQKERNVDINGVSSRSISNISMLPREQPLFSLSFLPFFIDESLKTRAS